MKHLKKFENFHLPEVEIDEQEYLDSVKKDREKIEDEKDVEDQEGKSSRELPRPKRTWGDEVVEKKKSDDDCCELTAKQKKLPPALQKAILARMKKKKK